MEKMKGKISKWLAIVLVLVMLTSSGVAAEDVAQLTMVEAGAEATTEPETATEPELTAEPEAATEPELTAEPETTAEPEAAIEPRTSSTPDDSPAVGGCSHQNYEVASTSYWGSQYSDPDVDGHTISTYIVKEYFCLDCDYQWEDAFPEEPSVYREPHSFREGVCTACGYKNQCTHTNVDINESMTNVSYSDINAEGHTLTMYPQNRYDCQDCGESWWGEVATEPTITREPHHYAGGQHL